MKPTHCQDCDTPFDTEPNFVERYGNTCFKCMCERKRLQAIKRPRNQSKAGPTPHEPKVYRVLLEQ